MFAEQLLEAMEMPTAWAIYQSFTAGDTQSWPAKAEEWTVADIVGRMVKWGKPSVKAENYLRQLVQRIAQRGKILAGADCPTGRVEITGVVLTLKVKESEYGETLKMLVQHETGWKVWGTCPSALNCAKGDKVTFTATVETKEDPHFGFFSRPAKARRLDA